MPPGMPASSIGGGQVIGQPNVCLTPAGPALAPMVYVSMGMVMMAVGTAPTVLLANMMAVTLGSQIPMTNGDQPGTGGGVASGMIMGPAKYTKGSSKVRFGGQPAAMVTSTTMQNQTNTTGLQAAPSQATVEVGM
jgi:Domain of unknown function (DUF4150)